MARLQQLAGRQVRSVGNQYGTRAEERSDVSPQSRLVAGIVLIIVPTVEIGGASILSLLIADPTYAQNDLRQDLWRAGHAHAGLWLVLSLIALRYVDEATLSERMKWVVRVAFPAAAILMPLAFFLSVLSPAATEPNAMIYLAYVAGVVLAVGLLVLGVGLIRGRRIPREE
jgi:heme/copper-type cytochrome/quinol oxidase subunit 4